MMHYQFNAARVQSKVEGERGASLVEYALLLVLIAIVCVSAVTVLGQATSTPFSNLSGSGLQ